MKLFSIIEQIMFNTYEGMVRVMYKEGESENMAELLRALPGVTTVTLVREERPGVEIFKIKLITQKDGVSAFNSFKQNAITKYSVIKVVKIAENSIEQK